MACLSSFTRHGNGVTLFSYEKFAGLPAGIEQRDAGDIVERAYLQRFITDGRPNIAAFSDYFRYKMFAKTNFHWADTDLFQLKDFAVKPEENLLVFEDKHHVCNALLRIRSDSPALTEIISGCEAIMDKDVPWAFTQGQVDKAFKGHLGRPGTIEKSPAEHLPVSAKDFYKLILPEFAEECALLCRDAATVHLYNNILDRIGVYKKLLPPQGSYLHRLFTQHGDFGFEGTYPAAVMRKLVDGWHLRFNGELIGVRTVVKQFFPSIRRTFRRLYR
jgi:hypothetical protein